MIKTYFCKDCDCYRPEDAFASNIASKTGKSFYCKVHAAARQRAWKKANAEKVKAWKKDYVQRMKNSVD